VRPSDVTGVFAFFVRTGLLPALAAGVAFAVAFTMVARRRSWVEERAWPAVLAAVLTVTGILVFTLFREAVLVLQAVASGAELSPPGLAGLRTWSPDGWWRATADPFGDTQVLLNIALFVPAGFVWSLVTRRPWVVVLALTSLSVVIEVVQGVSGLGANDVADIVANVLGAGAGAMAATVVGWLLDERVAGRAAGSRTWLVRAVGAVVVVSLATLLPGVVASQRQARFAEQAIERFAATSYVDIVRWTAEDRLLDEVWRAALSVEADGFTVGVGTARARYPASFLGAHRCVVVTWARAGVSVERHARDRCDQAIP
jgi:hypothetical protein